MREEKGCVGSICCRYIRSEESIEKNYLVLLHGYTFNSLVWKEIGLLQKLEEERIPFFALDMPYATRSECTRRTTDALMNLTFLEDSIEKHLGGVGAPILLGASMGGYFAILYAEERPTRGLILVGPVGTEEEKVRMKIGKIDSPVYIILGDKDTIIDFESIKSFASLAKRSKIVIYESSGHPAYLYQKDRFIKDVISFYRKNSYRESSAAERSEDFFP
ncbi:MAG: alpha/beta hydrolase [Fervidicoccaceae archaeon]